MSDKPDWHKLKRAWKAMNKWPYTAAVWRRRKAGRRPKKGDDNGRGKQRD